MERITSRQNSLVARIRKLNTSRAFRRECSQLVGEGPKLLDEAMKAGMELTAVLYEEGLHVHLPEHTRAVEMPADLLQSLCSTKTPQGVLFLCHIPETTPPEVLFGSRYLVLDGVQDPGNVGTIWRTADALGADGLLLVNGCADPFSPKTVRATMGACFRLPVYELEAEALPALLQRSRLKLYATALREDTVDVRHADLTRSAVVIGSEGQGISKQLLDMSSGALKIPMRERCESLNAAIAASLVLWEMTRAEL